MSCEPTQGNASPRRDFWLDVAISCLVLASALAYFSLTLTRTLELRDEGYILFESARSAAGEVPHRDFKTVYGPGVFLVNGLTLWLFDGNILPLRLLIAFVKGGAVVLTFLLSRLLTTRTFAVFGTLLSIVYWGRLSWNLNTPYAALYTIPLCMLAVFFLIRALLHNSPRGYVGAGLIAGAAILFKQSLGLFNAYGMFLAVCAVAALECEPKKKSRFVTSTALWLWFLAAIAVVVPFTSIISLLDYISHFLPFHLLMGLVAAAVLARGGLGLPSSSLKKPLSLFVLGLGVMPGLSALVYGYWGSLHELIFNMFIFPRTLADYYIAVPVPPLSLSLFMLGVIALLSSGLLVIRGRRRSAAVVAISGLGLMSCARYAVPVGELQTVYGRDFAAEFVAGRNLYDLKTLWKVGRFLVGVQAPAISAAALAIYGGAFFRPQSAARSRTIRVVIPLVLFQTLMCFQAFPRATYNLWQIQGALMPLLTLVLYRWYNLGVASDTRSRRKVLAAAATALVPLWMVAPIVKDVLSVSDGTRLRQPLRLPALSGIELDDFQLALHHIDEMEELVTFLRTDAPKDAPLFLLTNEPMIQFLSQRAPLFPERAFYLFLLGWGMLPEEQCQALDVDAMLLRLENTPEAILIFRPDPSSARLLEGLAGLRRFVTERYEISKQIGGYQVLTRRGG